jgi:hypothetical protein
MLGARGDDAKGLNSRPAIGAGCLGVVTSGAVAMFVLDDVE